MKIRTVILSTFLILGGLNYIVSQELLDILENEENGELNYLSPTFKMTRIAFGHSTEVRSKGVLELVTTTRFWNLPGDRSQNFVADKMSTRIALEYGVSDRLSFAVGATTFDGLWDTYLKYKLVTQKKGKHASPFNVTLLQSASYNSSSGVVFPTNSSGFDDRLSFTSQVLVSKKISTNFSMQLAPTYIHKQSGIYSNDPKNYFALGLGARLRVGPHLTLVSEYYNVFNTIKSYQTFNPFAIGANWELGDILLQFMLTNTRNMVEDTFITQTRNNFNFKDPNLHFGFHATYVFHLKNKLKK